MTEHRFTLLTIQRAIHLRIAIIVVTGAAGALLTCVTGITGLAAMVFLAKGLKTFPNSRCPLYANLTVNTSRSNEIENSHWGHASVCQFVIYLYVYVFINAHIWLWIILGSDLRDNDMVCTATSREASLPTPKRYLKSHLTSSPSHNTTVSTCQLHDRKSALFLLPFLGIHVVLVVACILSLILVTNGLSTFCSNLMEYSNEEVSCLDLKALKWNTARTLTYVPYFYSSVIKGTGFAWLTLLCLIAQVIVTLAQIQTSLNYVFPAISVFPASSEHGVSSAPPISSARSLSSISVSSVSPLNKLTTVSLSPPTRGDLHLSETNREEKEFISIIS